MSKEVPHNPEISIILPVYNEADNLGELSRLVSEAFQHSNRPYEIIYVDDGSTDRSAEVIRGIVSEEDHARLIRFKKNAGQSAAFEAGFKAARGEIIVTMDSDLQNDPHDAVRLLDMLGECDMVCGWRKNRMDNLGKRVSSRIANFVRDWVLADGIRDSGCTLRVFRKRCLGSVKMFNGMHRFLPTLFKMEGYKIREVEVGHHPRKLGKTKYGVLNRMFVAFYDLLAVRWMQKRHPKYEVTEER